MGKELSVTEDQMDRLVSVGYTGHDIGASKSDKQYEAFSDGEDITKKMYGKLFVRDDSNTTEDLKDEIEGTVIKIERGYEIRNEENGIEESGYGFLDALEKDEYEAQGFKPINMVKVRFF